MNRAWKIGIGAILGLVILGVLLKTLFSTNETTTSSNPEIGSNGGTVEGELEGMEITEDNILEEKEEILIPEDTIQTITIEGIEVKCLDALVVQDFGFDEYRFDVKNREKKGIQKELDVIGYSWRKNTKHIRGFFKGIDVSITENSVRHFRGNLNLFLGTVPEHVAQRIDLRELLCNDDLIF